MSEDEFEYSDAESIAATTASVSTGGGRKTEPFPKHIEKQLIRDIEAAGGLQLIDSLGSGQKATSQFLDNQNRPNLYGNRGDPIRNKISKRVSKLKELSREAYLRKVVRFNIEPATVPNTTNNTPKKPTRTARRNRVFSPPKVIETGRPPVVSPPAFTASPSPLLTKKKISKMAPTKYGKSYSCL